MKISVHGRSGLSNVNPTAAVFALLSTEPLHLNYLDIGASFYIFFEDVLNISFHIERTTLLYRSSSRTMWSTKALGKHSKGLKLSRSNYLYSKNSQIIYFVNT